MRKLFVFMFLFLCGAMPKEGKAAPSASGNSPAHQASRSFSPDPMYDAAALKPVPVPVTGGLKWVYGHGQLEAWKLEQLVREGFAVHSRIGYSRNYGKVARAGHFRHAWPETPLQALNLRALGTVTVRVGNAVLFEGKCSSQWSIVSLAAAPKGAGFLQLDIAGEGGEPVALCIEQGPLCTGEGWEWSVDGVRWKSAEPFTGEPSGRPPHQREEPVVRLHPVATNGNVYDFGVPVLGRPVFRAQGAPCITPGETVAEALAPVDRTDVDYALEQCPDGLWSYKHPLGFRYLRVEGVNVAEVAVEASFHPVRYRGAFACSDERLTRMWLQAAYTLRLCMHQLVLDGIKRDRMPWIGDLAAVVAADAYAFADEESLRQTCTALVHPTSGPINGIVDYSLWWVIGQDLYQRYFDDAPYLRGELGCMNALMEGLAGKANSAGLLPSEGWVFIDWGVSTDRKRTSTALQVLWYWSQRSMARLAAKAGDKALAERWRRSAEALAETLRAKAWNSEAGAWKDYLETAETTSPYPNFLAVLAGLASAEQQEPLVRFLTKNPSRGTPFMKAYELQALSGIGGAEVALSRLREYWGGMMGAGAVTFWEDFKAGEKNHTGMYGRPFARSLCHAWACGPVNFLPETLLGVRPLSDGWREFSVAPRLGELSWAKATIPTPHGDIEVAAEPQATTVLVPEGLTLVAGQKRHPGPAQVTIDTLH